MMISGFDGAFGQSVQQQQILQQAQAFGSYNPTFGFAAPSFGTHSDPTFGGAPRFGTHTPTFDSPSPMDGVTVTPSPECDAPRTPTTSFRDAAPAMSVFGSGFCASDMGTRFGGVTSSSNGFGGVTSDNNGFGSFKSNDGSRLCTSSSGFCSASSSGFGGSGWGPTSSPTSVSSPLKFGSSSTVAMRNPSGANATESAPSAIPFGSSNVDNNTPSTPTRGRKRGKRGKRGKGTKFETFGNNIAPSSAVFGVSSTVSNGGFSSTAGFDVSRNMMQNLSSGAKSNFEKEDDDIEMMDCTDSCNDSNPTLSQDWFTSLEEPRTPQSEARREVSDVQEKPISLPKGTGTGNKKEKLDYLQAKIKEKKKKLLEMQKQRKKRRGSPADNDSTTD